MGMVAAVGSRLALRPALTSKASQEAPTPLQLFLISSSVKIKIKGAPNLIPGPHLIATCTPPSSWSERRLPPLPARSAGHVNAPLPRRRWRQMPSRFLPLRYVRSVRISFLARRPFDPSASFPSETSWKLRTSWRASRRHGAA